MIALCLLLCGCKEQVEETDIRAAYREMSGCELTMKVVCGEAQREWVATLQCHYAPEGESTVEVTEPLELAARQLRRALISSISKSCKAQLMA